MWQDYFKVIKIIPGKVVTPSHGMIDFSKDSISLETIQALYEADCPYLEITPKGQKELYQISPIPPATEPPDPVNVTHSFRPSKKRKPLR